MLPVFNIDTPLAQEEIESPEYRTLVSCTPQITSALDLEAVTVGEHLRAKGLLSEDNYEYLIHSSDIPRHKARRLLATLTAQVKANSSKFDQFITVLKEQGDWTKDIVSILMEQYMAIRF